MTTKIDICAEEWCNIVFEGKNKNYGAFELRQMSAKRQLLAILLSTTFFALVVSMPMLVKVISPNKPEQNSDKNILTLINIEKQEPIKIPETPPAPRLRRTIQFVPPIITNDPTEEKDPPIISNILESTAAIGSKTQAGLDDPKLPEEAAKIVENEPAPAIFVEQMPEFPGGEEARIKFMKTNMRYPSIAAEMGITGRVILQFVVDKNGNIDRIKVLRGIGGGCDEEAIRVVKLMPPWKAGMQNGKNVPVYFTFPVVFALQN
jgi:protein TonB